MTTKVKNSSFKQWLWRKVLVLLQVGLVGLLVIAVPTTLSRAFARLFPPTSTVQPMVEMPMSLNSINHLKPGTYLFYTPEIQGTYEDRTVLMVDDSSREGFTLVTGIREYHWDISSDCRYVVAIGLDNLVQVPVIIDNRNPDVRLRHLRVAEPQGYSAVDVSFNQNYLAVSYHDPRLDGAQNWIIRVYEIDSWRVIGDLRFNYFITFGWAANSDALLVGGWEEERFYLVDANNGFSIPIPSQRFANQQQRGFLVENHALNRYCTVPEE